MEIILRWKKFIDMLEIDILRNSSQIFWVILEGLVSKSHIDALLTKTM